MTAADSRPLVEIFTDGACSGNPGPGGWAAVLVMGPHRKEISGGRTVTTNNIMELSAAIQGLRQLKKSCRVRIYSDSQYLVKGMSEWMGGWLRRNWKTAGGSPVANRDLWEELNRLNKVHEVVWTWIPAHHNDPLSSHPENARCDELAREAIRFAENRLQDCPETGGEREI